MRPERTGAGAYAALHAHLHPFAILDALFDFPHEVVLEACDSLFVEIVHNALLN
jgi:hypothetical protein